MKNTEFFNRIILYWFTLATGIFMGCETIVDAKLPEHQPVLVANSFFQPDSTWRAHISSSTPILSDADFPAVENATVEILEGPQVISRLTHIGNGNYRAATGTPIPGRAYQLRVSAPDYETISASDIIPQPIAINSVAILDSSVEADPNLMEISIDFSDPPNEKNYYHLSFLIETNSGERYATYFFTNDPLLAETNSDIDISSEPDFSGIQAVFDDALIAGERYTLNINVYNFIPAPELKQVSMTLSAVSKSFFDYFKTSELQEQTEDNPFAEPTLVYNNIKNGLGIFAGYHPTSMTILENFDQ